jgi:hypothetical protein
MPITVRGNYPVVLDADVLAHYLVWRLIMTLAEEPAFLLPRWSPRITSEARHVYLSKFGETWTESRVARLFEQMELAFPEALVSVPEEQAAPRLALADDRHVVWCALVAQAQTILTYNVRHYPEAILTNWNLEARTPDQYLLTLLDHHEARFIDRFRRFSEDAKCTPADMLLKLSVSLPHLSRAIPDRL